MFGYAEALREMGVGTVIVCPTTSVRSVERSLHRPTGATLVFLPPPPGFALLRRNALDGRLGGRRSPVVIGRAVAAHVAPYLGTPPRRLRRLLREERCEALLCQEYEHPRFDVCVAVGRSAGVPVFGTFQGGDEQHSRIERWLRPRAMRSCAGLVIAPALEVERVRARYGVPEAKVARIPNPVDVAAWGKGDRAAGRRWLDIPQEALVVAWHGQVQLRRKGLDVLLDAWGSVTRRRAGVDLRLVLAGSGEDLGQVRRLVADAALPGVHLVDEWVNERARVADLLAAADVYAFPSRHEGLAVAPIEALACGLAVVTSDARGVADVVGDAGVVVPTGDADALADAVGSLLDEPARRVELGDRGRRRAERTFSLGAVGARLRAFLLPGDAR